MTDIQTGKVAIESLVKGTPNVQVAKVAIHALVRGNPNPRLGLFSLSVLYPFTSTPPATSQRRISSIIT